MELIKIKENAGKRVVSARELYLFLTDNSSNVTRWMSANIESNDFAVQNVDYQRIMQHAGNGRGQEDYALTIDFAKELCMMSQCERGREARQYFIDCERRLKDQTPIPNFNNPAEAARAWALEYEEKQKAVEEAKMHKKHLEETVEKVEILKDENFELEKVSRLLKNIDGDITVDVFANETSSIFKMGRNKMFSFLREHNFLFYKWSGHRSENMPYQKYIDNGTFKVVSDTYYNPKENVRKMYHISMITPKGRESLIRYIGKKLR